MADFEERIVMEIGSLPASVATDAQKNQLISDALEDVISELPSMSLFSIAEEVTDSGSGVAKGTRRVLRAWKTDYTAEKVDYLYATDTTRTFTATDPVWYELGGTAYILPSGGSFLMTQALTADKDTTTITGANSFFDRLVIYKAALHALRYKMIEERDAIDAEISLPTTPTLPAVPSIAYVDATASTVSATTIGAFGTVPVYTQPTLSEDYTDYTTYFDLEDSEIGQLALAKVASQVQVFQADMADQMNVFNDANVEYQASIQKEIQQAQITLAEARQNAEMATSTAIANEARTLEAAIQDYVQELARHAQEVSSYQAQVNGSVQQWNISFQRAQAMIRAIASDYGRVNAEYNKAFLQYLKSYSDSPRIRVWHQEY